MNNCPKCGNPVQPGVTACPICGTSLVPAEQAPVAQQPVQEVAVEQVQVQQPAPVQPVQAEVAPAPQPVAPAPAPQPVQSTNIVGAPATNPVNVETNVNNITNASVGTVSAPAVTPDLSALGPQINTPASVSPIPSQQGGIGDLVQPTDNTATPVATEQVSAKPSKKFSFSFNKKTLAVIIPLLLVFVGAGIFLFINKNKNMAAPAKQQPVEEVEVSKNTKTALVNGFELQVEDGWSVRNYLSGVVVVNSDDSTIISLDVVNGVPFSKLTKENIQEYLNSSFKLSDTKVSETKVNGSKAFEVEGKVVNDSDKITHVRYLFVGGSGNYIITITVVYTNDEAKKNNSTEVENIIESVNYDASSKAISTVDMYADVLTFKNYILNYSIMNDENKVETN